MGYRNVAVAVVVVLLQVTVRLIVRFDAVIGVI